MIFLSFKTLPGKNKNMGISWDFQVIIRSSTHEDMDEFGILDFSKPLSSICQNLLTERVI